MLNGKIYQQQKLELYTRGKESGLWPTPTKLEIDASKSRKIVGNSEIDKKGRRWGSSLTTVVKTRKNKFPIPTVHNAKESGSPGDFRRNTVPLGAIVKQDTEKEGQLNPDWVDWLMGYPIGYTDLENDNYIQYNISTEPNIPRLTDRKESRKNRLQCLGNSIVPQIAELLFKRLKEIVGL
jgi:hypothetical protein